MRSRAIGKRPVFGHDGKHIDSAAAQPTKTRKKSFVQQWKQKLSLKHMFVALLVGILLLRYVLVPVKYILLGPHGSMRGGELGRMLDTLGRTLIFRHTMRQRSHKLQELGILLPPMKDVINKKGIPNLPQAAVAELLMRNKIRTRQLQAAEDFVQSSSCSTIPKLVHQPDHGAYFRPVHAPEMEVIRWDHSSMRRLVQESFPALLNKFDRTTDKSHQTLLWSLCTLYWYGGYVFGTRYRRLDSDISSVAASMTHCNPTAIAVFRHARETEFSILAATPQHPRLKRMIEKLSDTDEITESHLLNALSSGSSKDVPTDDRWAVLSCPCTKRDTSDNNCCKSMQQVGSFDLPTEQPSQTHLRAPLFLLKVDASTKDKDSVGDAVGNRIEVTISEQQGTPKPKKKPKISIQERLDQLNCNAGWICNRCLKNSLLGSHDACRSVCSPCYAKVICDEPDYVPKSHVTINVSVRERHPLAPGESKIPKIIHQTWFDVPTVDRYPQLARLQNSWKNTGWDYRFYTDATMRDYIAENYPARFVEAFDSVIPGAFKADFFRYLVLLKDGGVYSDVDILLDTNLDSFVTPTMSFFVPRDIVGDYAANNFCLWNGLMGAEPGHPFMAQAAETLLSNILNRVDYHDMERDMCRASGRSGEVWKMRALTILSLSGPCLLGQAVNRALGRRSALSSYTPGWLIPDDTTENVDSTGDALLLIASRADMGALRFSDVDRNVMVASTGMTELSKDRIETVEEASQKLEVKTSHIHYSNFEHANDVFGAESVYVNRDVTNEVITLKVTRSTPD